jgi:ATP-dependent Lon protease
MTGEITLRGRVLGVGGVKEKAVAALRSGMRRVILPAANVSDLELLPQEVREQVVFDLVRTMDEVMNAALVQGPLHVGQPALETGVGVSVSHG